MRTTSGRTGSGEAEGQDERKAEGQGQGKAEGPGEAECGISEDTSQALNAGPRSLGFVESASGH